MKIISLLPLVLALMFAPLIPGIIMRVKAFFAGRRGPPLLQVYYDLAKLFHKGAVYSETTSYFFRLGPVLGIAICLLCLMILPLGNLPAMISFQGDIIFLVYLLAVARFFMVLAAMDTGSSFEGMGASREMAFSALTEPTIFFCLATLARHTSSFSITELFHRITPALWQQNAAAFTLVLVGLFIVFLTENSRIPVDDPTTHLELTMIHEVMVLDHGGVDLGLIEYASTLKLWITGSLLIGIALPIRTGSVLLDVGAMLIGLILLSLLVGLVESTIARLKMNKIPQLLVGASALAILGLLLK